MSAITISVASKCDKAGRSANQDNMWVCPDLSRPSELGNNDDRVYPLSSYGALLVVADGMGGMNAGEVASEIVIDTMKRSFSTIPAEVPRDDRKIRRFIADAIKSADEAVKDYSDAHPEAKGMGSTLVMAWVVNGKVFVAWVGDSRAYCYNSRNALTRLSHDHSYVQMLVDNGQITEDEAFHHPQGNVITHSIGDTESEVHFDILEYPIHKGDTLLLCSDGLCGLLTDMQIQEDLVNNSTSMANALNALWSTGTELGWSDNATIALMRINDASMLPDESPEGWNELYAPTPTAPAPAPQAPAAPTPFMHTQTPEMPQQVGAMAAPPAPMAPAKRNSNNLMLIALAIIIAAAICFFVYFFLMADNNGKKTQLDVKTPTNTELPESTTPIRQQHQPAAGTATPSTQQNRTDKADKSDKQQQEEKKSEKQESGDKVTPDVPTVPEQTATPGVPTTTPTGTVPSPSSTSESTTQVKKTKDIKAPKQPSKPTKPTNTNILPGAPE